MSTADFDKPIGADGATVPAEREMGAEPVTRHGMGAEFPPESDPEHDINWDVHRRGGQY